MKWPVIRVWPSRRRLAFWLAVLASLFAFIAYCTFMPGSSFAGDPAALDARGERLERELRRHVDTLASQIGPRHLDGRNQALTRARDYLRAELERHGYTVSLQSVAVGELHGDNLEAVRVGRRAESFVIGAHYDSVALLDPRHDCPAADDNASGVAVALSLAEHFAT